MKPFVWFFNFYWLTGSFDLVIFSRSLARGRLPICSEFLQYSVRFYRLILPSFGFLEGGWCSEQKVEKADTLAVNMGWCSEQKFEKADTLAATIALQRLEIAIESFELQKGKFTAVMADFMPCAADSFHQLID
jgi:hypothetical protein